MSDPRVNNSSLADRWRNWACHIFGNSHQERVPIDRLPAANPAVSIHTQTIRNPMAHYACSSQFLAGSRMGDGGN
jgi:hypothetical protein